MKNPILFTAFFLICSHASFSQSIALNRAVKFYESNNIGFAEKEIRKALKTPVRSEKELARTMNYFFLIMKEVYATEEALADNLSKLSDIGKAYVKCKKVDKDSTYAPNLTLEMQSLGNTLLQQSNIKFEQEAYFKYLLMMDYYVQLMDKINVDCGAQYAKMAEASIEVHQHDRAMGYWVKMIESGYNTIKGYEMLVPFFYAHKELDIVDSLIVVADDEIGQDNLVIGIIEVNRLIEKDLIFKASKKSKQLLKVFPSNIELLYLFGSTRLKMKYDNEGLNALLEVTYLDETHFDARLDLARYYLEAEGDKVNLVLAKNYINQSIKLKPLDLELRRLIKEFSHKSNSNSVSSGALVMGR